MDNITFEAMPQAISELIQKVDTLQSTVAALQKHCSKQQVEQMIVLMKHARFSVGPSPQSMHSRKCIRYHSISQARCSSSSVLS